ncbi:AzlC family ABC transporter permease [Streptomyces sp. NPDC047108]|uniref:AzlC family ABC transporter permease n=1 Tax=Streptomyces sp. NPDC047108 TaxID=3155025 RepID=UPI0033C09F02
MERNTAADAIPDGAARSRDGGRQGFRGGLRVGTGLGAATFVLGITFGTEAVGHGWGTLAPIVCSVLVISGSAQFALLTALTGGAGAVTAVTAAALINARFVPMGVAVARDLRGGRVRRALEGQTVIDASWVAAHRGGGRFDRGKLFGATAVQAPAWISGTALGVVLAPSPALVEAFGLDVVFPAFFLMLLLEEVRSSGRARLAAGLGGAVSAGLVLAVPAGIALLGSTAGALPGLLKRRRRGPGREDDGGDAGETREVPPTREELLKGGEPEAVGKPAAQETRRRP